MTTTLTISRFKKAFSWHQMSGRNIVSSGFGYNKKQSLKATLAKSVFQGFNFDWKKGIAILQLKNGSKIKMKLKDTTLKKKKKKN